MSFFNFKRNFAKIIRGNRESCESRTFPDIFQDMCRSFYACALTLKTKRCLAKSFAFRVNAIYSKCDHGIA